MLRVPVCSALCVVAVLLGLPALAPAAQVGAGNSPDTVVDRDGTTHLVYNEYRPGAPDVLHYCRIAKGTDACADEQTFVPAPGVDTNDDNAGPRVAVTPFGEVILTTARCCGTITANSDTYVFVSEDDGNPGSFSGAQHIGITAPTFTAPSSALYDPVDRRVLTFSGETLGGYLSGQPVGQVTSVRAQLAQGNTYNPAIAQRGRGSFVAAWEAPGSTVYVRTFDQPGAPLGAINDPANWTAPVAVPEAEEPQLASGPLGTFLIYRSTSGASYRQWQTRRIDGTTPAAPAPLSAPGADEQGRFIEAADGRLHALFVDENAALTYRSSTDGGSWTPPHVVVPGPDFSIGSPTIAATTTETGAVGLALWNAGGAGSQNPPIVSATLPDPLTLLAPPDPGVTPPTPAPPPAPPIAGPAPAQPCQLLSFGPIDAIADVCFSVKGEQFTATGGVRVNGLSLRAQGNGRIVFDRKARRVESTGAVEIRAGDTLLWRGELDWQLPAGNLFDVGELDVGKFGGELIGFPLSGKAGLRLRRGAAEVPLHLGLPEVFGGVTGDVTLKIDNLAGVRLRDLRVKVGNAFIGPLQVQDLGFFYDADADVWQGEAKLILPPQPPGPSLQSQIGFRQGELEYFRNELTLPSPGIALGPSVFLQRIRFALETNPDLKISGGVGIAAGPVVSGQRIIGVDGDFAMTFAKAPRPSIFRVDGRLSVVDVGMANAFFEFRTNGYVALGGDVDIDLAVVSAKAHFLGEMRDARFNIEAGADVCVVQVGCFGGKAIVSSVGFAACADVFAFSAGAGYVWGEGFAAFEGCDIGPYRAQVAQAGGADGFVVEDGERGRAVAITGAGGPPGVALVAPDGRRIEVPAGQGIRAADHLATFQDATTYVLLSQPAAGTWRVEPLPGSAPVTGLRTAGVLPEPKITASVRTLPGGERELRYAVTPVDGQRVWFSEDGNGASALLGDAKGRRGTLRFRPANGPGGTRKIVAAVESFGAPRAELDVAQYVAPPPRRPGRARSVRLRRSGSSLVVSWGPSTGAARYLVRARLSDGRTLVLPTTRNRRRVTVPATARATTGRISVVGVTPDGLESRTAVATLKAGRR